MHLDEFPVSSDSAVAKSGAEGLECSWSEVDGDGSSSTCHAGVDDLDFDGRASLLVGDSDHLAAGAWHKGGGHGSDEVGILWLHAA